MGSLSSNSTVPHIHCFVSLVSWHVSSEVYCGLQQCSTLPIDLQPEEEFRRLRTQLKEIQMYMGVAKVRNQICKLCLSHDTINLESCN